MASPKITFRGAMIRGGTISNPAKGDKTCTFDITADWGDQVAKNMKWGTEDEDGNFTPLEIGNEIVTMIKLKGDLLAVNMVITPGDSSLKKDLDLEISWVGSFELHVMKDKAGEAVSKEIRFKVESSAKGAAALVESWVERVGRHRGQMKVQYSRQLTIDEAPADPDNEDEAIADADTKSAPGTLARKASVPN